MEDGLTVPYCGATQRLGELGGHRFLEVDPGALVLPSKLVTSSQPIHTRDGIFKIGFKPWVR